MKKNRSSSYPVSISDRISFSAREGHEKDCFACLYQGSIRGGSGLIFWGLGSGSGFVLWALAFWGLNFFYKICQAQLGLKVGLRLHYINENVWLRPEPSPRPDPPLGSINNCKCISSYRCFRRFFCELSDLQGMML
jgi:hypothetical protein